MTAEKSSQKDPKKTLKPKRHRCAIPGCGKAFTRLSHLQRHSLNHSETQLICSRCNAPFKRLDLLERHKARHLVKDRLAGGSGLGILQTRRKTFPGASTGPNVPSTIEPSSSGVERIPSLTEADSSCPSTDFASRSTPINQNVQPSVGEQQSSANIGGTGALGDIPVPMFEASEVTVLMSPSVSLSELGNMYYDTTFDSVHFDVMGFNRLSPEPNLEQSENITDAPYDNESSDLHHSLPFRCSPRSLECDEIQSQTNVPAIGAPEAQPTTGLRRSMNIVPPLNSSSVLSQCPNEPRGRLETPIHDVVQQTIEEESPSVLDPRVRRLHSEPLLTASKRVEILDLLTDIRPVYPDGSLVDGSALELSLHNMQEYLDLFLRYFNTSYPMVHVATLKIGTVEPIFLLSMIIMGATYLNKGSHQLSVCLYDAIVPYILSGLMSIPIPDLSTLQAFLILECYGMYRAGPYQRENAILIHTLLFSAIRRVSRYHVRGGIMLPNHLTYPKNGWESFANAEQYKRLILFVFMWDTQNVSCYSFMPSMSTQTIQVRLPCHKELWEARTRAEWAQLSQAHAEPPLFNDMVKYLVEDGDNLQSRPLDGLSLTLVLHGLMSMCNDMVHFDNRSIYLGDLEKGEVSWTPWRRRMTHALDTWKAKYDAYTMASVQGMATHLGSVYDDGYFEATEANYQKESIALLALYHTAHIVINCEIRNLQAAAGAKAIFGHIVTPKDREESTHWVRQWVTVHSSAADHAAWHAAQMFREGLLYVKNWDVNGVFHYPWCLVIGTLTSWAFHHFAGEGSLEASGMAAALQGCSHPGVGEISQSHSRALMNHLISLMASVAPSDIRRTLTKCCTHGLSTEVARYLKSVRWTAAYEAMKLLEGLSSPTQAI